MNISGISIGNNSKSNNLSLIAEIDKHIEIRFLKEGRRNKTYVYGLGDYIEIADKGDKADKVIDKEKEKEKELLKFVEKLQKKLGTSVLWEEKDGKKYFGFGGDHVNTIKNIVISELKVPKDKIKT